MIIDTHCHLDLYKNPLEFAKKYEGLGYIIIGVTNSPSFFEKGLPFVSNFKKVRLALGLHPLLTEKHTSEELNKFKSLCEKTSYIGEIGLDYSREGYSSKAIQIQSFETILETLTGTGKLLSLHSRRAEKDVFSGLIKYKIQNAVFHWYSGPTKLIEDIIGEGYFLSINPMMTISSNGRKIIDSLPLQNILTETDGPFTELNGKMLCPEDIILVFDYISKSRNISMEEVSDIIKGNFFRAIKNITS